eukprot:TRINITY_DN4916_c0_g1_i1.p1 TRINITY_DN4916_c0_g1~~TRINITY_DN4916_c0_g1_i1.p1  ORF type:complete len:904 (+),score=217.69 TRINITY_DN4916_c0_g1_i1:217-2712(+)
MMFVDSQASPAGYWQKLRDKQYRKRELYKMKWADVPRANAYSFVDLGVNGLFCAAPLAGPIALIKDVEDARIRVFTSAGTFVSEFSAAKGVVSGLSWSDNYNLICVMADGTVFVFSAFGHLLSMFSMGEDVAKDQIVQCQGWGSSFVGLTVNNHFVGVLDVESDEPRIFTLADPDLTIPPLSWIVLPPTTEDTPTVLAATDNGTILLVSLSEVHDQLLSNGPFNRMCLSPSGKLLACFTCEGALWVTTSDFAKSLSTLPMKGKPAPAQMAWCGNDSVLIFWDNTLLVVGPTKETLSFKYEEPVRLLTECDGARIISQEKCEFLQRVPEVIVNIFQIGSTSAGAMLYDAVDHFAAKSSKADENLRSIKDDLAAAVDCCIEAAGHEFNPKLQLSLLKAASFGKTFLDSYPHQKYVSMCKTLRVLNAVRQYDVGFPLTYPQYLRLTPEGLIRRLVSFSQHLLSLRICQHLGLPTNPVLLSWAIEKVRRSKADDIELSHHIYRMLKDFPGVSFARIASVAYKANRKQLATRLLDYEPRAADQVPLLLSMEQEELALSKAVDCGDTDLVYLVLLRMIHKSKSTAEFLESVLRQPLALDLLLAYCREHDHALLKRLYNVLNETRLKANVIVRDAFAEDNIDNMSSGLQTALATYLTSKECSFHAKMLEEQARLLLVQKDFEDATGEKLLGLPLNDTVCRLLDLGDSKKVNKIVKIFKIPDKTFWWLRIRTICSTPDPQLRLKQLAALAREKKSPIGYEPFAEVCISSGDLDAAAQYIDKIVSLSMQADFYARIGAWDAAATLALQEKNAGLLESLLARCPASERENILAKLNLLGSA